VSVVFYQVEVSASG